MRLRVALMLAFTAWLGPGFQEPTLRVTVRLVQVDVTVTDKNGRHVADLTKDEFRLLQDGRPQEITHFAHIAGPPPPPAPSRRQSSGPLPGLPARQRVVVATSPGLRPETTRRTVALVVDDLGLSWESLQRVKQALAEFVDQQVQPGDAVAILRTSSGIGMLQQFTADKRLLHAAINRVRWSVACREHVDTVPAAEEEDEPKRPDKSAVTVESLRSFERSRALAYTLGTLSALEHVVEEMRSLPGRKSAILFSDGISLFNGPEDQKRLMVIPGRLRRLCDRANRSAVVIYTIDARGLMYLGLTAKDNVRRRRSARELLEERNAEYRERHEGMLFLARETGGIYRTDTNGLALAARQAVEDQGTYYLLGYNPGEDAFTSEQGQSKFHRISVKVTRPGVKVRTRSGFFGVPDAAPPPERKGSKPQLLSALTSPFLSGGIGLRLTGLFGATAVTGPAILAMLHLDGRHLAFQPDGAGWVKAVVDVAVVSFGEDGAAAHSTTNTYEIRVRAERLEEAVRQGFVYKVTHPVKPGVYQIRAAVRDTVSEKIGSASQFIEAPDVGAGRLALSGILMDSRPVRKPAAAEEEDPTSGPAVRSFSPGEGISYVFEVYNPRLLPGTQRPATRIQARLYREGQAVWTGEPLSFDSASGQPPKLSLARDLKFGPDTPPGQYLLQVLAWERTGRKVTAAAIQWMDFELGGKARQ